MLMVLASGEADGLTGRHISPKDPVDKMLNHQDVILKDDLYTLRRRTL
jgi:hypothetical protein